MRTVARETLFKIIFSSQFTQTYDETLKRALIKADKLDESDISYCDSIIEILTEHGKEFTEIIDGHSRLFPESRLFPADRSVILIALAEIFYRDDIPDAVSVNEAVNIAAKYSTGKSASFVNGLLAEVLEERNV